MICLSPVVKRVAVLLLLVLPIISACKHSKDVDGIDGEWRVHEIRMGSEPNDYYVEIDKNGTDTTHYKIYNMFNFGEDFCVHLVLIDDQFTIMGCDNPDINVSGEGKLTRSDEPRIDWVYSISGLDIEEVGIMAIYTRD